MENFFGIGTCDAKYDNRRHYNLVFQGIIIYNSTGNNLLEIINNSLRANISYTDMAKQINTKVLSGDQSAFLFILRELYNISNDEAEKIHGLLQIDKEIKSPAGYSRKQCINFLVELAILIVRFRQFENKPAGDKALLNYYKHWALGQPVRLSESQANTILSRTQYWLAKYPSLDHIKVIQRNILNDLGSI